MQINKSTLLVAVLAMASVFSVQAQQEVNFASSFVVPEKSGLGKVRIGGIAVAGSPAIYAVDFALKPDYSLGIADGVLLTSTQDSLEQALRNTTWTGTYVVLGLTYTTKLTINAVQAGYVGAEITHTGANADGSLTARLGGELIKRYTINGITYDEDAMSASQIASVVGKNPDGYIVRIKRTRAISYSNGTATGGWSSNREYRLTLDGTKLSGAVAVPGAVFGDEQISTGSALGEVVLTKQ